MIGKDNEITHVAKREKIKSRKYLNAQFFYNAFQNSWWKNEISEFMVSTLKVKC